MTNFSTSTCAAFRLYVAGGFGKVAGKKVEQKVGGLRLLIIYEVKEKTISKVKQLKNISIQRLNSTMDLCGKIIVIFGGKEGSRILNDVITINTDTSEIKLHQVCFVQLFGFKKTLSNVEANSISKFARVGFFIFLVFHGRDCSNNFTGWNVLLR